jgi:hypothetical protein
MTERKQLDREVIEEAFRIMGQYLLDRKALGEIAIYGGSAILLQFDWRRTCDRRFFPDHALPTASEQRLRELARTIQSKTGA